MELVGTSHFRLSDHIRKGLTPEVTPKLARMLSVMTGEMSRAEIMAELGLRDEKHFRDNHQQYGINQDLIEMMLPDTPRSRKQRYRLTARGKELRETTKRHGGLIKSKSRSILPSFARSRLLRPANTEVNYAWGTKSFAQTHA